MESQWANIKSYILFVYSDSFSVLPSILPEGKTSCNT